MERGVYISLAVWFFVGVVDSISYMAVAPSLIFYVTELGGSKDQYGLIMSACSFAMFCFKPMYGYWVDAIGNKYKAPLFVSFSLGIFGNIIYWLAILMPHGNPAVYCLLVARLFTGMGAANNTLGFSYLATTVPYEKQTIFNVLMSISRIIGMTMGPFVNMFLTKIDTEFHIGGLSIPMNSRNCVGLFVAFLLLLILVVSLIFMEEPPKPKKKSIEPQQSSGKNEFWKAVCCFDIFVPLFIIVVSNCNFQMIETAFPPAAAHGLGWGPVQTSSVMGINALFVFVLIMAVMVLSMRKVPDHLLIIIGNCLWIVGGTLMYILWTTDAEDWHFVVPFFVGVAGFPFISPSNRSIFTLAVAKVPELEGLQSSMQSVLSMAASLAGIMTPSLVAIFVLRDPNDVDSGSDNHQLTLASMYVPIGSGMCIALLLYQQWRDKRKRKVELAFDHGEVSSEKTPLVPHPARASRRRSSAIEIQNVFSVRNEVSRRFSAEVINIAVPFENLSEREYRDTLWEDKNEFETMDTIIDGDDSVGNENTTNISLHDISK